LKISLKALRESKCQNIWHDMIRAGKQVGADVEVPDKVAQSILAHCAETQPIASAPALLPDIQPIPFEQWPLAYQKLIEWAEPGDIGIGDIIERKIAQIGGTEFKKRFKGIFGRDCGCEARKEKLNLLYPILRPTAEQLQP
jgi:hypothetical protein